MVLTIHHAGGYEGSEALAEDIMWDFLPGKTLPGSEADGDGGVEVATGSRSAGDDGESDTECERETDLQDTSKTWIDSGRQIGGVLNIDLVQERRGNRGDTGIDWSLSALISYLSLDIQTVEEHSSGFGEHLPQPSRSSSLKVKLALGDRLGGDDMALIMPLDGLSGTNLELVRVKTMHVVGHGCRFQS